MTEIDSRLWELGANNPELQRILAGNLKEDAGGYTLPKGNIREYIFSDSRIKDETREAIIQQIHDIDKLPVSAIATAFEELRAALIVKEVTSGEPLKGLEKTFKDMDITALILFGVRRWLTMVSHEPKPEQPVEGSAEE